MGFTLVDGHERVHAVNPYASLLHVVVDVGDSYIFESFDAGSKRSARCVVWGFEYPPEGLVVAFGGIGVAFQHHLCVAEAQVECLHFSGT